MKFADMRESVSVSIAVRAVWYGAPRVEHHRNQCTRNREKNTYLTISQQPISQQQLL